MTIPEYNAIDNDAPAIVAQIPDFNIVHTFENGQCFRYIREHDGSYTAVAGNNVVNVSMNGDKCVFKNTDETTFNTFWHDYFDLGTDYAEIKRQLRIDPIMEKAVDFGWGIRILKQSIWEMLISFIISANNNIPSIMRIVDTLSRTYGQKTDKGLYAFPQPQILAEVNLEQLKTCRAGFRCKYIKKAAEMVYNREIDLYNLKNLSTDEARNELIKIPGVGPKIADCVLLYSGTKYDIFPTDVWIKRIMETLYLGENTSLKQIQEFSRSKFGKLAGFAQLYLFYYARQNKIGT